MVYFFLNLIFFNLYPLCINYQLLATIKFWILFSAIWQYIGPVDSLPTCRRTSTKIKEHNNQSISRRICRNNINYFLIYEDIMFSRKHSPARLCSCMGLHWIPPFREVSGWRRDYLYLAFCVTCPPPQP